ncbi:NAD-glutamate dehydrogenase domain-containing protein [Geodermatophilus sp. CPCC 205761]|uniref:NAD-glutamate dehydrogenase domain-containing protein n=1 Tax=Geodermatophilus sp. CPCC 205761 TaxID=2936597 RepID=UPI003EF056C9
MTCPPPVVDDHVRSWTETVREHAQTVPADVLDAYLERLPHTYVHDCPPSLAAQDLIALDRLEPGGMSVAIDPGPASPVDGAGPERASARLRIRMVGTSAPLHRLLPILQSLGIDAIDERPHLLQLPGGDVARVYDLAVSLPTTTGISEEDVARVVDTFAAAWSGEAEVDGFNRLVLAAGLDRRGVGVLRAYCGYLRQSGLPYTRASMQKVLTDNVASARALVALFDALLGSVGPTPPDTAAADDVAARAVDAVAGLDADRILRSLLTCIRATTRTNLWSTRHRPGRALAIKLTPTAIDFLPKPRPRFEVYVHGTALEGVHLRFDLIARGGLRWSDRLDDYRTEVLGLVKAQAVKNAVIVPAGAKGGFVVKRPSPSSADVEAGYREFVACLLDVTDDLDVRTGDVVPAPGVRRRDGDDYYLVVAADKGTARFSDIANDVATGRGYWLGDAFASGGTVGYDHKAMGITARGAWESVRRHFRELGVDIDVASITVSGIGDMSGDVFGNGMLLSDRIRLVAAFDHRHVVIDPDPDPERSYQERRRLFTSGRSSWADYDPAVLSEGAIVVPRTAKSVPLTPQARARLGLPATVTTMTAHELVRAVLLAPVDLLWNGGVGTYVKARSESHLDCGDKANDPVRVDAAALRVRVIGEGGNLGVTQRGRIEFARAGGRVNTDAMDNSAGVDCSDHEVNIKIALGPAGQEGALTDTARRTFLTAMTDAVAGRVLRHNAGQNELMGANRAEAADMLGFHARLVDELEESGVLDRDVDLLPTPAQFAALEREGRGLTSPELAQLTALVKNDLSARLLATTVPDEPTARERFRRYFPRVLVDAHGDDLDAHPLRREIATTTIVNEMVDTAGITFVFRIKEDTAAGPADAARAFDAATSVFGLGEVFADIRAAAEDTPATGTDALAVETRRLLDRAARWFTGERPLPLDVQDAVHRYRGPVRAHSADLRGWLRGDEVGNLEDRTRALVTSGAPEGLARRVADLLHLFPYLDIADLAHRLDRPFPEVAQIYFVTSSRLRVHTHLTAVSRLDRRDRSHALARLALREDLYASLRSATADVLTTTPEALSGDERVARWEEGKSTRLRSAQSLLSGTLLEDPQGAGLASLCAAARQIRVISRY